MRSGLSRTWYSRTWYSRTWYSRTGFSRTGLLAVLTCACLLAPPAPLFATSQISAGLDQATADPLAIDNRFLILYPELKQAPAPRWLQPGVRLSYNFAYATFDPGPEGVTPSGSGILQYDVVAQDRRTVVLLPTMYSPSIKGQPPTALPPSKGLPGIGDVWFAPEVLANAEAKAFDTFQVAHMPMTVEGQEYKVVRMQSTATNGAGEEVWAFDEGTGVLVFYRQALYGADGEQKSGHIMTLVDQRKLRLPWRGGTAPAWVKQGVRIDLAGAQLMDLGGPPYVPLPMAVSLRITASNPAWSDHMQTLEFNGRQLSENPGVTGVAQIFGGLWLPPQALGKLKAGAVLDRDPVTGVETRVETADRRQIAVIAEGPGYLVRYTYDAAGGRLIAYYQEAHFLTGVQFTELSVQ